MSQVIIGIDIAKLKFDVVRLCDGKYKHAKFANNTEGFISFVAWLNPFGDIGVRICMETTGAYGLPLAEFLTDKGCFVSVVNLAQIHAFGKGEMGRAKIDKADATIIPSINVVLLILNAGLKAIRAHLDKGALCWKPYRALARPLLLTCWLPSAPPWLYQLQTNGCPRRSRPRCQVIWAMDRQKQ